MTKLEAKNIVKYFSHDSHNLKALGGVNLKIESGDFVCLVGPSGCGKSTFLRIVAGLETPDDGQILFDYFSITRTIRRGILEAGQDTEAPDFGLSLTDKNKD